MTQAVEKSTEKPRPNGSKNALAIVKEQVVDQVAKRVDGFLQAGQLHLPQGYSAHNAMHAAWLVLQEVRDSKDRPALEVCSRASIANALFSMVVQGLDPLRKQVYFIPYGQHLACQRSYFGTITVAQRMAGVAEVLPMVRYADEPFKAVVERGRVVIERHEINLDTDRDPGTPITHAYCIVEFTDDRPPVTELMRWDQIQTSWKKSRQKDRAGSMHQEQPDQAAIRTVVNRALKRYINASTDAHLGELIDEIHSTDTVAAAEAEMEIEVAERANRDVLTLDAPEPDPEPAPAEDDDTEDEDEGAPFSEAEQAEIRERELAEAQSMFHDEKRQARGPGF